MSADRAAARSCVCRGLEVEAVSTAAKATVSRVPVTPEQIQSAATAIRQHIRHTPVLEVSGVDVGLECSLSLKLEYLQRSGTFKGRGAAHFLATQPIASSGIVAASGGNHGAAVAWAAQRFGHEANIFVPTISAPAKVERLRSYGAIVHQIGDVYAEAFAASQEFQAATGATSIHAYDDPIVMAGAGTCAMAFWLLSPMAFRILLI